MTRKIPHLGNTAHSSTASHDCHYCGQRLPEHLRNTTIDIPGEPSRQLEQQSDKESPDQVNKLIPDPDITLPETATAAHETAEKASSNSDDSTHTIAQTPAPAPEMCWTDSLSKVEKMVVDFVKEHALSMSKSKPAAKTPASDPPSYDAAMEPLPKNARRAEKTEMNGMFHASSKEIKLQDGHILVAQCADPQGRHWESTIDLNECLTNRNASLQWQVNGNFKASARNASISEDGQFLELQIQDVKGYWMYERICLSERISNQNGKLVFLKP